MIYDGISLQGSYHGENQDSCRVEKLRGGLIAAVSDGLGSKLNSGEGSRAACEAAVEIAVESGAELGEMSPEKFLRLVHARWKGKLSGKNISECCATLLVFVLYEGTGFALRLGDGFLAFQTDAGIRVLFDRKEGYYSNETDCLAEKLAAERAESCEFELSEFCGAVLCTDGVTIGDMTEEELTYFMGEFVEGYAGLTRDEISADIREWLGSWPGTDDKTLAWVLPEQV